MLYISIRNKSAMPILTELNARSSRSLLSQLKINQHSQVNCGEVTFSETRAACADCCVTNGNTITIVTICQFELPVINFILLLFLTFR